MPVYLIIILYVILASMALSRQFYSLTVYIVFSILMVALVGYDPASILFPIIFTIGLLSNKLRIKTLKFPIIFKVFLFILVFSFAISCLWSPTWNLVIRFCSGLIFFYFTNLFIDSADKVKKVFFCIIFGTIASSCIALSSLVFNVNLGPMFFPVFESFRFAGLYNTTILGIFSAVLIIWVFDEIIHPKLWQNGLILKVFVTILLTVQMLSTLTRSAWLGFIVAMVIYLAIEFIKSNLVKKVSIALGLVTLVIVITSLITNLESAQFIRDRISEDTVNRSEDEIKRANFYFTKNALKVAFMHPLGVGIGKTQKHTELFNGLEVGAHNNFIMVLSDMGWLAFVGYMLSQIYIFFHVLKQTFNSKVKFGLSAQMLLCSNIILLVSGMFQDLVLYISMWLIPSLTTILIFPLRPNKGHKSLNNLSNSKEIQCVSG